jgi:hypothetical protein
VKDKNFDEILADVSRRREESSPEEIIESFPLIDGVDEEILLQREAHFGGSFDVMLDYYKQEGKGVQPHLEPKRIEQLKQLEEAIGENLAPLILSGADAEKIQEVRESYKNLRAIYELRGKEKGPSLIADLILTEDREGTLEVAAIVSEKKVMVPLLLDLIRSEQFHDPLFPGYGKAPFLAAKCLGMIGDPRIIITLFNEIGEGEIDDEMMVLKALRTMGEPAKAFLLRVVRSTPYGEDNERAAFALLEFRGDEEIAEAFLALLADPAFRKNEILANYALLGCEALKSKESRQKFRQLIPPSMKRDGEAIIATWAQK